MEVNSPLFYLSFSPVLIGGVIGVIELIRLVKNVIIALLKKRTLSRFGLYVDLPLKILFLDIMLMNMISVGALLNDSFPKTHIWFNVLVPLETAINGVLFDFLDMFNVDLFYFYPDELTTLYNFELAIFRYAWHLWSGLVILDLGINKIQWNKSTL
jgi:hypothetical protein